MRLLKLFRIAVATLTVFLPTIIVGLLFIPLVKWAEWALENWSWAKESERLWDRFADKYLPRVE